MHDLNDDETTTNSELRSKTEDGQEYISIQDKIPTETDEELDHHHYQNSDEKDYTD